MAYTAIQQLEGVVLQPLLMKEGLELPPVMTILGQALFSLVFGFLGLLLAVPLHGERHGARSSCCTCGMWSATR